METLIAKKQRLQFYNEFDKFLKKLVAILFTSLILLIQNCNTIYTLLLSRKYEPDYVNVIALYNIIRGKTWQTVNI